jgi:hypothetical protein
LACFTVALMALMARLQAAIPQWKRWRGWGWGWGWLRHDSDVGAGEHPDSLPQLTTPPAIILAGEDGDHVTHAQPEVSLFQSVKRMFRNRDHLVARPHSAASRTVLLRLMTSIVVTVRHGSPEETEVSSSDTDTISISESISESQRAQVERAHLHAA